MICPNCGAAVPPRAKACPECGSDNQTGWSEDAQSGGLDVLDESFDYDAYVKREFGNSSPVPHGIHWFWWAVALLLLISFLLFWLR
jgi:hypothetical protein